MIAENNNNTTQYTSAVTVSLDDLQSTTPVPDATLLEAFGPSSLGILVVSGLPPHFSALRSRVLTKISRLAHLPQVKLDALVNEKAKYLVGWSHGKETLRAGAVDWLKGSYYVNTAFAARDETVERMRREWAGFDEYLAANIWPDETDSTDGLEGFRRDVEELVTLIVDVARHVARSIDRFAEKNVENWPLPETITSSTSTSTSTGASNSISAHQDPPWEGYLEGIVSASRTSKARLLHYFPSNPGTDAQQDTAADLEDSWCTIHKDHGCLTGLTSAAFFDETSSTTATEQYTELDSSPSPSAGLYILDRNEQVHKVSIPRDSLAFQTGEALELVTRGKLKAVKHFVRGVSATDEGVKGRRIARNTLAVFTQPNLYETVDLDRGITFGDFARGVVSKNTTG